MKMHIFSQSDARNFFLHIINPLTPNSRKCSISPHSFTAKLNLKVVRMKKTVAPKEAVDCQKRSPCRYQRKYEESSMKCLYYTVAEV